MRLSEIRIVTDGGPFAEHNYPCPIKKHTHAIYNLSTGNFEPSWEAQEEGWRIIKLNGWFQKVVFKMVFMG